MSDPFKIERMIIECFPKNIILAGKAAKWLLEHPYQKDAIVAYGEGEREISFYVRRNKASILIRQNHK